jgi:hypothetical protein
MLKPREFLFDIPNNFSLVITTGGRLADSHPGLYGLAANLAIAVCGSWWLNSLEGSLPKNPQKWRKCFRRS